MKPLNLLKREWLQLLILAAPFCAAVLLWDKLPGRVPIHWNIHGKVDGYAGKAFGVLFLPAINLALTALLAVLPRLDPKCRNYDDETQASVGQVFRLCRLAMSLFMTVLVFVILAFALHYQVDVTRVVVGGLGILLAVMGNSMGKLRPNYFAGFRTPWTLESRTVWLKTHRLGGRLMIVYGAGLLVESFLLTPLQCMIAGVFPLIVLVGVVPAVYSYFLHRAEVKDAAAGH